MSSMQEFDNKMTLICDEVRELSGETGALGLDALQSNLDNTNIEVNTQSNLIEQIVTALEGKASGGSGGSNIETCNLQISTSDGYLSFCYYTILDNGHIYSNRIDTNSTDIKTLNIDNIICGSYVDIGASSNMLTFEELIGAEIISSYNNRILRITAGAGETAIIKYYNPF